MSLLLVAGVLVLPFLLLLGALCFGVFNWEKPGGKALAIIAASLLILPVIAAAAYSFLLLPSKEAPGSPQPVLQQH